MRLVEQLATEHGRSWETVNAGVGGIGLENEMSILAETGLSADPDAVLLQFYLNDFQESPGVHIRTLPPLLQGSRLLYHVARLASLYRAGQGRQERADVEEWRRDYAAELDAHNGRMDPEERDLRREALSTFSDWGGAWSPRMWEYMRPLFQELQRMAGEHHIRLCIAVFPVRRQVEAQGVHDYPQQQMARVAADLGVPAFDLLPVLRAAHRESEEPLFYDHCHPTPRGNRVIAAALYDSLAGRWPADTTRP